MGSLLNEIEKRRSFRAFSDKEIPDGIINRIMTAATYAPSCSNNQSWRFLVVYEENALAKLHEVLSGGNYWMKKAPVVVVVATKIEFGCQLDDRRDYAFFDCGLAVENLLLQAFNEGLIAHPIAGFNPAKLKDAFGIADDFVIITLIGLGYAGDDSHLSGKHKRAEHSPRDRVPEADVICRNVWGFED